MIKQKTPRDKKYLAFVKDQPCCICGWKPSRDYSYLLHAHHTESGGMGIKGSDYSAVPLCFVHHDEIHQKGAKNNIPNLEQILKQLMVKYQWLKEAANVANADKSHSNVTF